MPENQLKAFLEAAKVDAIIRDQLKAAADLEAVVSIAKAAGFEISAEELKNAQAAELSDKDLEDVAGGACGGNGTQGCGDVFCIFVTTWK